MSPRTQTWLPVLVGLQLWATTSAGAAPYVVEGITLGARIPLGTPNYRSYQCKPSEHFEGYTWCERTQPRRSGGGSLASAVMHATDGTALYLSAKQAPIAVDRASVQREIDELSKAINERPTKVEWAPARSGLPASVIATWGKVELRKLRPDDAEMAADDDDRSLGLVVDSAGDLARAAKAGHPIYRIGGGAGFVYTASFDVGNRGHRRQIAVDVSPPALAKFEPAVREVLEKDQSLAADDYSLWSEVASLTRSLSIEASPAIANEALDRVYAQYSSKKLRSRVWSLLPLGSLANLPAGAHWSVSIYGPNTGYPDIRESITKFLAEHPSEPFSEFLYYTIGEFDKALAANPNSVIAGVVRYAIAHKILETLLQDTLKVVSIGKMRNTGEPIDDALASLNGNPDAYGGKLLGTVVPSFAAHAAAAQPWFEQVMADKTSPHQDDAAYMLGWLNYHQGKTKEALSYFAKALTLGNGDYRQPAALRQIVRIMARVSAREQVAMVESDPALGEQAAPWYMAARSAFRSFDYALAVTTAERGLKALKIPLDRLPATTDPQKIKDAFEKIDPKPDDDLNLYEMPYLLEASREFLQYESHLASVATDRPDSVAAKARAIIFKYSMLLDPPAQGARRSRAPDLAHKDLRQALHLVDITLDRVPKTAPHAALREWLHYRKVRILVQFAPKTVAEAIAAMEQEFPKSQFMDDALAEQIYAEGVMLRDVTAAQKTFQKLLANFPKGNSVDNAYTWMAIVYRCTGRTDDAAKTNRDIIRLFPMTRHARYARDRAAKPQASACGLDELSRR